MLGAGQLIATLWKSGDESTGWRYRFNLFRQTCRGRVGQRFCPDDVLSLVKLARVLAAELVSDGCLDPERRAELVRLAALLETVIHTEE